MPETLDEFVYWVCDHCEAESCGNVTTAKPKANVSHRKGPTSLVEEQGKVVASKGMEGEMGQQRLQHNGRKRKDVNSPLSTGSKEYSGTRARVENDRFHPAESNARRELIKSSDAVDKIPLIDKWNEKQMKGNYSVVNSRKEGAQKSLDVPQQAAVHQEPPSTSVELARPLIEPVWRGGFFIQNTYAVYDGLAAHLSTKVGLKVYEEAKLFPASLKLDMYPKADVWPKSFQKSQPSDGSIALYFFATEKRSESEKLFDHLVRDMMRRELALKAIVENAELLIFTSNELPSNYWRFRGNYYLWGVFRAKQSLSS